MLFLWSWQNSYLLHGFEFGCIVTSPGAVVLSFYDISPLGTQTLLIPP